jgi:ATP adenylyltransferase/5',5'''-P-1,P-4-tetraphosphate phosphorylase II
MRVSIPLSISSRVPLVAPITACAGKQIKISTNSMEASTVIQDAGMTWSAITDRYDSAQSSHIATITDTAPEVLVDALPQGSSPAQIHFLLRIATALREKPKGPSSVTTSLPKTWRNPFLPPDPDLFVCHLSASHSLVLNKFNVVPHHVLVITREFAKQEEPLTAEDMEATLAVVQCMPGDGGLAYFNRGPCSGASQPHKHIQVGARGAIAQCSL